MIDEGLIDLTLGTVSDGVLEDQFQERLHEALDCVRDHQCLAKGKDGIVTVTIPLEVALSYDTTDGTYSVASRANPIKKPKPIPVVRPVYRRDDGMKVRPEIQPDLLSDRKPTPIDSARGAEVKE